MPNEQSKRNPFDPMDTPYKHDYGCTCEQCRTIIAAIEAKNPDGTYFYTEAQLDTMFGEKWNYYQKPKPQSKSL